MTDEMNELTKHIPAAGGGAGLGAAIAAVLAYLSGRDRRLKEEKERQEIQTKLDSALKSEADARASHEALKVSVLHLAQQIEQLHKDIRELREELRYLHKG